ncbi:MAG: alpha-L-fucosidase C-terminal domain-containing protein [Bacteroidales bacterium]
MWFQINGDAVYATRPWSIYGEGPSTIKKQAKNRFGGLKDVRSYTAEDIRYTVKNDTLNAFVMEIPNKDILLSQVKGKIKSVRLLGSNEKIIYDEGKDGLKIKLPAKFPCNDVPVFQIVK